MEPSTQNGKSRWKLPTFGCEGCASRKSIMGAGNWQVDAAIVALIIVAVIVMWRVKVA